MELGAMNDFFRNLKIQALIIGGYSNRISDCSINLSLCIDRNFELGEWNTNFKRLCTLFENCPGVQCFFY
jgi:hypothetical protein